MILGPLTEYSCHSSSAPPGGTAIGPGAGKTGSGFATSFFSKFKGNYDQFEKTLYEQTKAQVKFFFEILEKTQKARNNPQLSRLATGPIWKVIVFDLIERISIIIAF